MESTFQKKLFIKQVKELKSIIIEIIEIQDAQNVRPTKIKLKGKTILIKKG